jgi:hypothetical protein
VAVFPRFFAALGTPLALAALVLVGCASPSDAPDIRADRLGESANVVPTNPKGELLSFLRTYLNDPARIRDATIADPMLKQEQPRDLCAGAEHKPFPELERLTRL